MRVVFTIPPSLWMTSNRPVTNLAMKSRIVRDLHLLAAISAAKQSLGKAEGRVTVEWEVRYPKGTTSKADAANAQPTTKALLDGLVQGKHLPDDGPKWVASELFRRGPNLDERGTHQIVLTMEAA